MQTPEGVQVCGSIKKTARLPGYLDFEKLKICMRSIPICTNEAAESPMAKDGSIGIGVLLVANKNMPLKKMMPSSTNVKAYNVMTDVMYP